MTDPTQYVPGLVEHLRAVGVQLWHNRGRLFLGPLSRVDFGTRNALYRHKTEVIEYLKANPPRADFCNELVAPRGPANGSFRGAMTRRPWDYEVAVLIPTLGEPDLLRAAVACWRHQTVSPYIIVVDTGSQPGPVAEVEYLRNYDVEAHFIGCHGWRHSSSPVGAAMDVAFAVCQTDYALCTHADVFPRRYDLLERLLERCGPGRPVLGYQMSPRIGTEEWKKCPSHTCTMVNMRVMRRDRVTWNILAALEERGEENEMYFGWPDTETRLYDSLRASGLTWESLGPEPNRQPYETDLIVHWRSYPSMRQYGSPRDVRQLPHLGAWLAETSRLGVAAPLPPVQTETGPGGGDPVAEVEQQYYPGDQGVNEQDQAAE